MAQLRLQMKTHILSLWLLSSFLLTACNSRTTNVVERIFAQATFQPDPSRAKEEIKDALDSATLVVRGVVVNSNTSVKASTNQTEVSPGQGWFAIVIRPQEVLSGKWDDRDLFMSDLYQGFVLDSSTFPHKYSFTNGERCVFFLKPDEDRSRWCRTNVTVRRCRLTVMGGADLAAGDAMLDPEFPDALVGVGKGEAVGGLGMGKAGGGPSNAHAPIAKVSSLCLLF